MGEALGFIDVTLVDKDGQAPAAHHVILGAVRPLFRHFLEVNSQHHPLIYSRNFTKKGQLQEECRRYEEKFGIRVPVVTRAGQSVRRDAKAEPLRVVGCDRDECFPCTGDSEKKRDCEKNYVGYRITCLTCQLAGRLTTYDGESGRNGYARGLEHLQGLKTRSNKSPLWKHCSMVEKRQISKWRWVLPILLVWIGKLMKWKELVGPGLKLY